MYKKILLILAFILAITSNAQESYYNGVNFNLTGLTLKEALANKIISTHTRFLFYDQIWEASKVTDISLTNNQEVVLIYGFENGTDNNVTNDRTRGINNNGGGSGNWNREHVYSQSLGTPPLSSSGPGSDAHHLRPADAQRNSSRNNRKFTDGSGNSGIQANGGWYPGDEWKGDVARMMMYMYIRYDDRCLPSNIGFGNNSNTLDDMIDLFLKWNMEDPVSDFEKKRNSYHENTTNQNAQGNRNPFIDNPILATRIWGGTAAEDIWGIFTSNDVEAPTSPTNLSTNNVTTSSINLSWNAATDNVAVTSYDVYVNGVWKISTTNTFVTIANLVPETNYSFTVLAKDIVNNSSELSQPLNIKTLVDNEPPTQPKNITISNQTESTFVISWDASTDNTEVSLYEIYIDELLNGSTKNITYTVNGLSPSTTYKVRILAIDNVGNQSVLSNTVNATTTNGASSADELFISEYIEGSSNNKAIEIVNLTPNDINLSNYSIKRQSNGGVNGNDWDESGKLTLTGYTIKSNNTFVIVNGGAAFSSSSTDPSVAIAGDFLIAKANHIQPNAEETGWGAPLNFNGNDPVGLFKNNILIDIVGTYNGGSSNFAKDKTLRRKSGVSHPNTNFDIDNEWDLFSKNIVDDIGKHSAIVLSTKKVDIYEVKIYPNPTYDKLQINSSQNISKFTIDIYNYIGKKVKSLTTNSNQIDVSSLKKGIYFIKINSDSNSYSSKFIKK